MARTAEEEEKRSRRWKLLAGLGLGALAAGVPAVVIRRRNHRTPSLKRHGIGRAHSWSWQGVEVSFDRLGRGAPLVLLHSLGPGHDGKEWHASAEFLSHSFDLWIPDLPGWGRSADPAFVPSVEAYETFVDDLLLQLVGQPAHLVAVGRSAGYAIRAAAREPGLVRSLGLVNPWGLGPEVAPRTIERLTRHLAKWPILRPSALTLISGRGAIRRHLEDEVFAAPERVDAAVLEHYTSSSRQPGADRTLAALLSGRLDPIVGEVQLEPDLPVWLAWGRRCRAPTVELADLWLRWLPTAELDVFDDSALLPHLEEAGNFSQQLITFLDPKQENTLSSAPRS